MPESTVPELMHLPHHKLPDERVQSIRVRFHPQAWVAAQSGGVVLREIGTDVLRGIRVTSKQELRTRIELYLKEMNEDPTVFKWKYELEVLATESIASP